MERRFEDASAEQTIRPHWCVGAHRRLQRSIRDSTEALAKRVRVKPFVNETRLRAKPFPNRAHPKPTPLADRTYPEATGKCQLRV
ncbi:hypothetical protein G3I44_18605 [Halogeometricum borinquense]|uniref:Uncharacterized protein n=1 Tax=Halogeometricum borinquense TaxID=60847 RepID=A0A6C0UNE2_9EURY|nr:hypothetical protein [Halogeometricum borinquense]QIB76103.1 hypothetical protein G3I44_18605 [Halogeometricum borinquense]